MATQHYIVCIEGLTTRTGEKIRRLTNTGMDYTTSMTKAMRIRDVDVHKVKAYLKRHGIADWVMDSPNTFVKTSYVPKGTLEKFPQT